MSRESILGQHGGRDRIDPSIIGSLRIPAGVVQRWADTDPAVAGQADLLPFGHRATLTRIAASARLPNGEALVEVTYDDLLNLSIECTARLLFDSPCPGDADQAGKATRLQLMELAAAADKLRKTV